MPPIEIKDEAEAKEKICKILEIFSFLDDVRWNDKNIQNDNVINYCREDLTPDEKLLTHWLCYIMDRQMPFRRIWTIGGYIISDLVHAYMDNSTGKKALSRLFEDYTCTYTDKGRIKRKLKVSMPCENKRLERSGLLIDEDELPFSSRYMPEDLIRIYRTLDILDKKADRSFARFISNALGTAPNPANGVKRIASALNQLTYDKIENPMQDNYKMLGALIDNEWEFQDFTLTEDEEAPRVGRKRLWAALRDYLKSPVFNKIFVDALKKARHTDCEIWDREEDGLSAALKELELPGDVWNNSEVFRKGLFEPYVTINRKSWKMPQVIRALYEELNKGEMEDETAARCGSFYPEQMDVTFDFIPRMCANDMCQICLFGAGIEKACHQKEGFLCPVVLVSCGYTYECEPSSTCTLKENSVGNFCKKQVM